ncbi:MAG: S9 family peptidase, partial [Planctomycetota bacterium]
MRMRILGISALVLAPAVGLAGDIEYPRSKTVDQVDVYHGVAVEDPYRWLENDVREDSDVARWVQRQNAVTQDFLGSIGERDAIKRRLTKLWDYERYSAPSKVGDYYVFSKNDGLQNQSVLYSQD